MNDFFSRSSRGLARRALGMDSFGCPSIVGDRSNRESVVDVFFNRFDSRDVYRRVYDGWTRD